MKTAKLTMAIVVVISAAMSFTSCSKFKKDSSVTVTNTFQSTQFTNDTEMAVEGLFGVPAGSLAATATFSKDDVEFPAYLMNLYDIDIDKNTIKFTVVAQDGDPNYGNLFRVLEAGTYDRYYFTFDKKHKVKKAESSNPSVKLRIDSDNVLVVEIGEGYDFKPGQNFTITLK